MQIASTLLNYGAETNIVTKQGVTPLHLASQEGHTDMVTLLLEKGANIHMPTKVFQFGLLLSWVFWVNVNRNQSKIIWNKKGACIGEKWGYLIELSGSKGVKPYKGLENQKEVRGEAPRLCLEGCLCVLTFLASWCHLLLSVRQLRLLLYVCDQRGSPTAPKSKYHRRFSSCPDCYRACWSYFQIPEREKSWLFHLGPSPNTCF